jgi:hypothetical protein
MTPSEECYDTLRSTPTGSDFRAAETSLRELGSVSLEDALGYLDLPAEQKPEKLERAAVRWHGRLETEATFLSLAEFATRACGAGESVCWRARCSPGVAACFGACGQR